LRGWKIAHVGNTCDGTTVGLPVVFRDADAIRRGAGVPTRARGQPPRIAERSLRKLPYNHGVEADPQATRVQPQLPDQVRAVGPAPGRGLHGLPCQPKFLESAGGLLGVSRGFASAAVRREL